jgi:hypothetical protein
MHEVITQDGVALRLDAWRAEVAKRNKDHHSLELFAASNPSEDMLRSIANTLACHNVGGNRSSVDIFALRHQGQQQRDCQFENILLMHQCFLLYEEMSHAMNYGDIGRIETLFPPWMALFKATGKHKYARHMGKFLQDVHWVYPEPLRHAVRYNILVNPTGKEGAFRAPDWIQEYNNLKTKVSVHMSGSLSVSSQLAGPFRRQQCKLYQGQSNSGIIFD